MKAETQTYYQALIDNRDSPFIVCIQFDGLVINYRILSELLTYLLSKIPGLQMATTKSFHGCRSFARTLLVPPRCSLLFHASCSTVCRQFVFGLPLFLLSSKTKAN